MIHKHLKTLLLAVLLTATAAQAQQTLTLKECRQKALEANKGLKMANEKVAEADELKNAALCQFFPKVSANGAYLWMQKDVKIISDEQQNRINNIGTTEQNNIMDRIGDWLKTNLYFTDEMIESLRNAIGLTPAANDVNQMGQEITDALQFDMNNIWAGSVTVTQPIYMGGKIRALYKTASLARDLTQTQYEKAIDDQLVAVDAAYWQVITVQHKQQLAQQYYNLVAKLMQDVQAMKDEDMATEADLTKVRVKLNEAQMSLTKANNGLALSRMLLNQLCGFPLNDVYNLVEDTSLVNYQPLNNIDMPSIWNDRKELKMLEISKGLADASLKASVSTLLPNIGATGGYVISNPNLLNGFQNSFGGMFMAGVVVNIPICHPASIFAVKAAKHKQQEVLYQIDEAKDKIQLQINKLNFELQMANEKLAQAQSNLANAEENLKLAEESFASGLCSSSDLMGAQTAWLSAKTDVEEARIEIRVSHLYLRQAMGADLY